MKELGDFQRYLLEEFVEDWREGHMSRRDMVRRAVYLTGGAASAATVLVSMGCGPVATPTAAPTKPAEPTKPAAAASPTPAATTAPTAAPTSATSPTTVAATTLPAPSPAAAATKPAAASPAAAPTGGATPAPAPPPLPTAIQARSPLSVKPDDPAIDAKKVDFPGEAGKVLGYLVRPKPPGTYAGIVVIHENRGLVPHIEDVARRAAKDGFVALAVDLLSRQGGTEKVGDDARASGLLGQAKPEDLVADLSAGVKFLESLDGVKKDKIGAIGFCFGGGYTWRLAVANKDVKAAAPFYGPPPPLDQIPNTNAAILGIYAEQDQRITATMAQVEDALKKGGKTYEMKVYPGVGHAFHNDTGSSWNEKAAVDAWQTAMAWFKKYLA